MSKEKQGTVRSVLKTPPMRSKNWEPLREVGWWENNEGEVKVTKETSGPTFSGGGGERKILDSPCRWTLIMDDSGQKITMVREYSTFELFELGRTFK